MLTHLGRKSKKPQRVSRVLDYGHNWAMRILADTGFSFQTHNIERMPKNCGVIIVANHQASLDTYLLSYLFRANIGFLTKNSLFKIPIFSYYLKTMQCDSLDRSDHKAAIKLYPEISRRIAKNKSLYVIFPEGTRSKTDAMLPFKASSFRIATAQGLPIMPVFINGTRGVLDPKSYQPGALRRVSLSFGQPIYSHINNQNMNRQKLSEQVRTEIENLRQDLEQLSEAR